MAVDADTIWAEFEWWRAARPSFVSASFSQWRPRGSGYLAGEYPDGLTTVDGVPVSATVRVFIRSPMPAVDGLMVAEVQSGNDGTWRVDGLDPDLVYDVVARKDGHNDTIVAGVSPVVS